MLIINCEGCKEDFKSPSKKKKFCTNDCYHKSRIGKKQSESCVEKRRNSMIGKKHTAERVKNMSLALSKKLDEEILNELKRYFEAGMPDGYIMKKLNISFKVFRRYKKNLYPSGIPWQCKFLENDIELAVVEEVVRLTKLGYRYKRIAKLVDLGIKTVRLILKSLNKKDESIKIISYDDECWSKRAESKPERIVREFLEENLIDYKQEHQIELNSKWYFDFHVVNTNLLIEVQGDYWHCNPKIFKKPLNEFQQWSKRRDFAKMDYAKRFGFVVAWIWEDDIKNNLEETKKYILRRIEECKLPQ